MPEDSRPPPARDADLSIRKASSSDIEGLSQLEAAAFSGDRLTRSRLRALAKSPSARFLVAYRENMLAGYVLVLTRSGSRAARLYSLAVAPAVAGQGIGARLLDEAEAAARNCGAEELRLEVRADNEGAIRLYERRGYRVQAKREDYYEDGATAICYSRDIASVSAGRDGPKALGRAA